MNTIQKAATAVMALVITLTGAVLSTAPIAFADSGWIAPQIGYASPAVAAHARPSEPA